MEGNCVLVPRDLEKYSRQIGVLGEEGQDKLKKVYNRCIGSIYSVDPKQIYGYDYMYVLQNGAHDKLE